MKLTSIIWDWNGTLIDDRDLCVDIMNRLLQKYTLPELSMDRYLNILSFPIRKYYNTLGFHEEIVQFEKIASEFIVHYEEEKFKCKIRKNAIDTLELFRKHGVKQFILSASKQDSLDEIVKYHNLTDYFTDIYGLRDHYANGKIEIGNRLLSEHKIDTKHSLFIGDCTHDAEVADTLGIPCILVEGGHNSLGRLQRCECRVFRGLKFIPIFYQ